MHFEFYFESLDTLKFLISTGSLFRSIGAAVENALSPQDVSVVSSTFRATDSLELNLELLQCQEKPLLQ